MHMDSELVDRIDDLLPQTQCTQCGYTGCRPYAEAIVAGDADINQCPPGGDGGIRKLASLLGRPFKALDPSHGIHKPMMAALIDERWCIGCTLCIQACPVDAIVGAPKRMHTVLLQHCTGCELCIPPCPVDCIDLLPLGDLAARGAAISPAGPQSANSRARYLQQKARRLGDPAEETARPGGKQPKEVVGAPSMETRRAAVEAALNRARSRRANLG